MNQTMLDVLKKLKEDLQLQAVNTPIPADHQNRVSVAHILTQAAEAKLQHGLRM